MTLGARRTFAVRARRRWLVAGRVIALLVTALVAATASAGPADGLQSEVTRVYSLDVAGADATVTYCSSASLTSPDPATTRAVVAIHGANRNACDYARFVGDAAELANRDGVLVIAPKFATVDDFEAGSGQALIWDDSRWKVGGLSLAESGRPPQFSSFAVIDRLIDDLVTNPGLSRLDSITVAGHSAGGQFVQRYAASTDAVEAAAAHGVTVSFVVANPGSYLYLDDRRLRGAEFSPLGAAERDACPGYNDYRYGLDGLERTDDAYRYVRLAAPEARTRVETTRVDYLVGELDNDPEAELLDLSCEARWQGAHRRERGETFARWLEDTLGSGSGTRHRLDVVAGVGHSARLMFASSEGQAALFDSKVTGDATCDGVVSAADVIAVLTALVEPARVIGCDHLVDFDNDGRSGLVDAIRVARCVTTRPICR